MIHMDSLSLDISLFFLCLAIIHSINNSPLLSFCNVYFDSILYKVLILSFELKRRQIEVLPWELKQRQIKAPKQSWSRWSIQG